MNRAHIFAGVMSISLLFSGGTILGAGMCGAGADVAPDTTAAGFSGTVLETTNASRYTYVLIDTGTEKVWAAGPKMAIKVGDRVSFPAAMPNKNFYSPTLKKNFDELYFVETITPVKSACVGGVCPDGTTCTNGVCPTGFCPSNACPKGSCAAPAGMGGACAAPAGMGSAVAQLSFDGIQKPAGGKTVAEVWAEKDALAGKAVVVRAKVVKVVSNILGKNFVHLRDGTGAEGANDLTVTTKDNVKVQDIVTASGTLIKDKDFGAGYKYDVILEDATVTVK